jgi:histidinol-phosphate aminotransferase
MKNYALEHIQKIKPYSPPLDGRSNFAGTLLDFNERTSPVNPKIIKAMNNFIKSKKVQLYPEYFNLTSEIAKYAQVKPEQVMITNGADQAIEVAFRTFTAKDDNVIIPSPSFAMLSQSAKVVGNNLITPFYNKELEFPLDEVCQLINNEKIKLLTICNPNNPTGTLVSYNNIKKILSLCLKKDVVVLVDEIYFEFSKLTVSNLIDKFPNLIVLRSFSKSFGLPSLRIGYILTQKTNILEMLKVRGPYDINMVAVHAAFASLKNINYMQKYVDEIMNKSKPLLENFFNNIGLPFFPSSANFLLTKPKSAENLCLKLQENGILTRPRHGKNIENTLRISIGTLQEMKLFIKVFKSIF